MEYHQLTEHINRNVVHVQAAVCEFSSPVGFFMVVVIRGFNNSISGNGCGDGSSSSNITTGSGHEDDSCSSNSCGGSIIIISNVSAFCGNICVVIVRCLRSFLTYAVSGSVIFRTFSCDTCSNKSVFHQFTCE